MFNKGTVLLIHFSCFLHKAYSKVDFGHAKISDAIFWGQSLLLSTTVLNDIVEIQLQNVNTILLTNTSHVHV